MDYKTYNVHFVYDDQYYEKQHTVATSKETVFDSINIRNTIAIGGYPYKITGPLGQHKQTPKQKLAQQYRSCIGALAMAEKNISFKVYALEDEIHRKQIMIQQGALNHIAHAKRDIKDLFKRLGLHIK